MRGGGEDVVSNLVRQQRCGCSDSGVHFVAVGGAGGGGHGGPAPIKTAPSVPRTLAHYPGHEQARRPPLCAVRARNSPAPPRCALCSRRPAPGWKSRDAWRAQLTCRLIGRAVGDSPFLLQKTSSARSTCGSSSTSCPPPATVSSGRHRAPTSSARCSASASRSGTVASRAPWHWKTGSAGLSANTARVESSASSAV